MNSNTKLSVFIFAAVVILFLLFILAGAVGARRTDPPKDVTPTLNGPCLCPPPVTPFPTPTYDKRMQAK